MCLKWFSLECICKDVKSYLLHTVCAYIFTHTYTHTHTYILLFKSLLDKSGLKYAKKTNAMAFS